MKKLTINNLIEIYSEFAREKSYAKRLEIILDAAMEITNADAGTLYVYENSQLHFRIIRTKSMGVYKGIDHTIEYPPVDIDMSNACAYAAIKRETLNIPDVNVYDKFDFEGPKKYDAITGYHTKSMLVIPMENDKGELVGVVQLINSIGENGNVVPFPSEVEEVISTLATQAAVGLTSLFYSKENIELIHSFVKVMSTAIDERSKFNSNHTAMMVKYAEKFMNWLDCQSDESLHFDKIQKEQIVMAIWLHDIGKLITPETVLNKQTRLDYYYERIISRIEMFKLCTKLSFYENRISKVDLDDTIDELNNVAMKIEKYNKATFLTDEDILDINTLSNLKFIDKDYNLKNILTEQEVAHLSIRTGSLTDEERKTMQDHVLMTEKMLSNMKFTRDFRDVPKLASSHHEFLDGTGYPNHFTAENISIGSRIITLIDIFEAITATDRPYTKPRTPEDAFKIVRSMSNEGKLDSKLTELFIESKAWEK